MTRYVRLQDHELQNMLGRVWQEVDMRQSEAYHLKDPCKFSEMSDARRQIHIAATKNLKMEIGSRL